MSVSEALSRTVRARAGGRCQYCLKHESHQGATFHIEHIIPQCKGGVSDLENLALACPGCNLHKAGRITEIERGAIATLADLSVVILLAVSGWRAPASGRCHHRPLYGQVEYGVLRSAGVSVVTLAGPQQSILRRRRRAI